MRLHGYDYIYPPMMILIDYRGFRLIAVSLLPISSDSLVYGIKNFQRKFTSKGSSNGGATVVASDPYIKDQMKVIAESMKLKVRRMFRDSLMKNRDIYLEE